VLFFLHVPKTAGLAVTEHVLRPEYSSTPYREDADGWIQAGMLFFPGYDGFFKPRTATLDPEFVRALHHRAVAVVSGHYSYGLHEQLPERPTAYMTMLRDPVDRVWSLYRHINAWTDDGVLIGDAGLRYERDVDLHVLYERFALRELDNDQTRRIAGVEPPYGECTNEVLELAKRRLERDIHFVGLAERLTESMQLAARTFGWTRPLQLERRNESSPEDGAEIDSDLRALIADHNRFDVALYEHAAAVLERRLAHRDRSYEDLRRA
jgi:hypothetical protein